ncbi:response regulator [Sphingomonas jatrophae]|uniref:histidine kinase n=1 Tax=Sphingomonas jatrophae TaxID=1166337 RepID=A0A1I6LQ41_9SPHN|nr:response regulator [Sphingomonas jatrophae]SFS05372.1 His Kinase A (phospho-acceptor) domain-containing protein [Sphingomonas jatrophae]
MIPAGPSDELARLAALRGLGVLDSLPEPQFDDLVLLARQIAVTPIALVSLVDHERQWFKARSGLEATETPRSLAFCAHAIQRPDQIMVVPDATRDPRFAANPLVTGAPGIRFYAGVPIVLSTGEAIGTVCVIDTLPRADFPAAPALAALARQAATLLEYRRDVALRTAASMEQHRLAEGVASDLDRLWRLAHDLMIVTDLDARLLAVNPAWEALFGPLPQPGLLTPAHFHHPDETEPLHLVQDGQPHFFRRHYIDRGGRERFISWTLTRSGDHMFGVGRDDTALVETEETLRHAQKMEAVGQLTGGIAHDFNNLLTIVLGNLDIASRRLVDGNVARAGRAIGQAQEGAERAATLTRRLLAFARRQPLSPQPLDPATQVRLARDLVEGAVGDRVAVRIDCAPACWPVLADPVQLESALLNLAVNARDAMKEGGHLLLATANISLPAAPTSVPGRLPPGDYVRFTVADTGSGMDTATLARVFEPFFTTKEVGKGTGLGLSQVHGFAVQSGGSVTIDSRVGEGTAVHLWLPRSAIGPREATMPPRFGARPAHGTGARVMVVEDNDQLRELVVTTLRDDGYRVIEAHDGQSGLALFARQERAPDIVLSDIQMPNMDGLAMARAIRARSPETRIVMMTGYADHVDGSTAELIVKPFTPDQLLARLASAG